MDSAKNNSNLFFPTSMQYRETCLPQEFLLPLPVIKYIWTKPSSPNSYQKLIQCCKLFFIKNPILIINSMEFRNWTTRCWHADDKRIKLNKLHGKVWLTENLYISGNDLSNYTPDLIPKIYMCSLSHLSQNLSYNDLKFLSAEVTRCVLGYNLVMYDSGEEVPLEDIIELFSTCKNLHLSFSPNSRNAICQSYEKLITACKPIENIELEYLSDNFDVHAFYQHLKNTRIYASINIKFDNPSERLSEIIDEILQTKTFAFVPPIIHYLGCDWRKYIKMQELQKFIAEKYC